MEINTTFLFPLGAMFVLLIIFRVIIFNAFVKLTSKTKSKHDDRIAEKLKRPLTLIPIGINVRGRLSFSAILSSCLDFVLEVNFTKALKIITLNIISNTNIAPKGNKKVVLISIVNL